MKRYLIILFSALILSITAIGTVGTLLLGRTLNLQRTETFIPEIEKIQQEVKSAYAAAEGFPEGITPFPSNRPVPGRSAFFSNRL